MVFNNLKIRNILLCLWFVLLNVQSINAKTKNFIYSIEYQIKPDLEKKILYINAKFYGDFKYIQKVELPYQWANENYFDTISDIKVLNSDKQFSVNKKDNYILIIEPKKQTNLIEINYAIHLSNESKEFNLMKLIMYNDFIYSPGKAILALPKIKDSTKNLKISILWSDIPKDWQVQSPYTIGNFQEFSVSVSELLDSVFILGNLRTNQILLNDKIINFSFYGSFDFADKKIIELATKIIKSQRKFFSNVEFKNYSVIIIENPTGTNNSASMGGNLMCNTIAVHLTRKISLTQLKLLLAHEHLHNWIGNILLNSEEILNYWWSEGFTEYYTRVLSLRHNIVSQEEFVSEINYLLNEYYSSAYINISNLELNKQFRNNYNISRIPYLRGMIFALYLNCKIKPAKQDASIDNVLKYFTDQQRNITFSNKNFVKAFSKIDVGITQAQINKYFGESIINGKTISLKDCLCQLPLIETYKPQNLYSSYSIIPNLNNQQSMQLLNFFR